jgi:hypothetical protein
MASLYNDRMVFIHVPKTGGTWLMKALEDSGVKYEVVHQGGAISHVYWNEMPPRPFRFGFVRYPPTWYRSYWRFVHNAPHEAADNDLDQMVLGAKSFRDFVETAYVNFRGFLSVMYEDFLGPPGAIEFIGRYENLQNDVIEALQLAGESDGWAPQNYDAIRNLPPLNVSTGKTEIPPDLADMILDSESQAVERFYGENVAEKDE